MKRRIFLASITQSWQEFLAKPGKNNSLLEKKSK
jgi:hypothetical protein